MRCWLGFGGRTQMMTYAFPFLILGLYAIGQIRIVFKKRYVIYALIVFFFNVMGVRPGSNINAYIYQLFLPINILLVLCIPDKEKDYVLSRLIKWFGSIMFIGVLLYLVNLVVDLPSLGVIKSDYGNIEVSAGFFKNYIAYIKPLGSASTYSFLRFNGPFIEPGDLGCTAAFMLMAAKFDFKRYDKLIWIFIALIVSMSLAGYLLTIIAYFFVMFSQKKISKMTMVATIICLFGIYFFGTYYNGGDNVFNEAILSRLQSDEEKGFSGNNRNSLLKTQYFLNMFSDPHTMWFGYDARTIEYLNESGLGAGFINKAINVGMFGMIGLLLPYLYIAKTSSSKKYAWLFFVFFLFYMYQRSEATWICYIICYVYGIVINERRLTE